MEASKFYSCFMLHPIYSVFSSTYRFTPCLPYYTLALFHIQILYGMEASMIMIIKCKSSGSILSPVNLCYWLGNRHLIKIVILSKVLVTFFNYMQILERSHVRGSKMLWKVRNWWNETIDTGMFSNSMKSKQTMKWKHRHGI